MASLSGLVYRSVSAGSFLAGFLTVMAYHVRAETTETFSDDDKNVIERLLQFPQGLTNLDLLILGILVTAAFEGLDHLAKNWGGTSTII